MGFDGSVELHACWDSIQNLIVVRVCLTSFMRFHKNFEKRLLFTSSCLSVRMEQLCSHWAGFYENWYLRISLKMCGYSSSAIKVWQG
jgi:hypothetical protein